MEAECSAAADSLVRETAEADDGRRQSVEKMTVLGSSGVYAGRRMVGKCMPGERTEEVEREWVGCDTAASVAGAEGMEGLEDDDSEPMIPNVFGRMRPMVEWEKFQLRVDGVKAGLTRTAGLYTVFTLLSTLRCLHHISKITSNITSSVCSLCNTDVCSGKRPDDLSMRRSVTKHMQQHFVIRVCGCQMMFLNDDTIRKHRRGDIQSECPDWVGTTVVRPTYAPILLVDRDSYAQALDYLRVLHPTCPPLGFAFPDQPSGHKHPMTISRPKRRTKQRTSNTTTSRTESEAASDSSVHSFVSTLDTESKRERQRGVCDRKIRRTKTSSSRSTGTPSHLPVSLSSPTMTTHSHTSPTDKQFFLPRSDTPMFSPPTYSRSPPHTLTFHRTELTILTEPPRTIISDVPTTTTSTTDTTTTNTITSSHIDVKLRTPSSFDLTSVLPTTVTNIINSTVLNPLTNDTTTTIVTPLSLSSSTIVNPTISTTAAAASLPTTLDITTNTPGHPSLTSTPHTGGGSTATTCSACGEGGEARTETVRHSEDTRELRYRVEVQEIRHELAEARVKALEELSGLANARVTALQELSAARVAALESRLELTLARQNLERSALSGH